MATFTKTGSGLDYIRYLADNPVKQNNLNNPALFDFTLARVDGAFVPMVRGDYITFATPKYPKFFTGYVTSAAELDYGGADGTHTPRWLFKYEATDDSYLLNLKPLGIIPPYLNATQGFILKDIVERITPALFDTTNVMDGLIVARYVVDPTKKFSDIVEEFTGSAYYSFRANDFKLYYQQVDAVDATLVINCASTSSSRVHIGSSTNTNPIVITATGHGLANGAIISITDHLINTNANGNWEVAGVSGATFQLVGSVGNGIGVATGFAGLFNPHFVPANLDIKASQSPIVNDCIVLGDVEPSTYLTEYFVSDGYTDKFPLLSSIYGVEGAVLLDEVFSGTEADPSKWTEIDTIDDYIRVDSGYLNIIGGTGDLSDVYLQSTNPIPIEGNLRLTHGEFDFVSSSSGVIASLWTTTPTNSYSGCIYGIRCSGFALDPIINGSVVGGKTFTASTTKRYIIRTLVRSDEIFRLFQTYTFKRADGTVGTFGGGGMTSPATFQTVITEIEPLTGLKTNQKIWSDIVSLNASQLYALYTPIASSNAHITISNITISVPMQADLEILPDTTWVPVLDTYDQLNGQPAVFDLRRLNWVKEVVGPNEIDSFDGLAPAATIITSSRGKTDRANPLSSPKYNPGDASLVFFKDSAKLQSSVPNTMSLIKLKYRRASVAIGRAINSTSIAAEAVAWGDDGHRTLTKRDASPAPRTSFECELAAAAIVEELGFQHYEGTYKQDSHFEFTGEPMPGTTLRFANLASDMPVDLNSELITSVKSTVESSIQNGITHEVTFGDPDRLKKLLSGFQNPLGNFAKEDTAEIPTAADLAGLTAGIGALNILWYGTVVNYTNFGTFNYIPPTYLDSIISPALVNWYNDFFDSTVNVFNLVTNVAPPAGGAFEIRYTDAGWGTANNKNLIGAGTSQTFTIPKIHKANGNFCFMRPYDGTGKYSRYSTAVRISFPEIPTKPQGITSAGGTLDKPRFRVVLPTDDSTETGNPILNNDIFGVISYYMYELSPSAWFERGATLGTPYIASSGDNPGPYKIVPITNPAGLMYDVNTVTLQGQPSYPLISNTSYINTVMGGTGQPLVPLVDPVAANLVPNMEVIFFVWVKAGSAGDKIRLNIKDNLTLLQTPVPFGFYSRADFTFPDNTTWYPIFTRTKLPATIDSVTPGQFNLVIQNIGSASTTIKFTLPFVGVVIAKNQDITVGASPDSPYLQFDYDNSLIVAP